MFGNRHVAGPGDSVGAEAGVIAKPVGLRGSTGGAARISADGQKHIRAGTTMSPQEAECLVRKEAWYSQLYSQNENLINDIFRQNEHCKIMMVGIQGHMKFGIR